MTLEQQICSLELAKRLKELGVKQESCFWWCDPSDGDKTDVGFIRDNHVGYKAYYSAFTVAELGEMLLDKCPQHGGSLNIRRGFGKWLVGYGEHQELNGCHVEGEDNEADARAKMLIHLIENKLFTL